MAQKRKNIVAELGRPETAAETAARKANDTRLYRERKTVNNLVLSLLVTLGLVIVIVLIVPRGVGGFENRSVNVQELAAAASPSAGHELVAPQVPEGWKAKQAELRFSQADRITNWYIGYSTNGVGSKAYAAVVQAFTADGSPVNDTWIQSQLQNARATGTESIGGIDWTVYDATDRDADSSNVLFALVGEHGGEGGTTLIVSGTDSPEVFRGLAAAVATDLTTN